MLRFTQKVMLLSFVGVYLIFSGVSAFAQDAPSDYQEVLKLLDRKGDHKAGVLKVNIPRSDLKMTIQGVSTPTPFGFGGWIAMTKSNDGSDVMMGDIVLLQEEVNPVMSALLDHAIEITALHNHFFWDDPRVFFMHVHAQGRAADLARSMKPGLDLIGHVKPPAAWPVPGSGTPLDTEKVAKIVGQRSHGVEYVVGIFGYARGRRDCRRRSNARERSHARPESASQEWS